MVKNNEENSIDSLKDIFYNTYWGRTFVLGAATALAAIGCYGMYRIVVADYTHNTSEIIQKNVRGNPSPEVYIERDGVRYYSHLDGKSLDELVDEKK